MFPRTIIALAMLAAASPALWAQSYPSKPVRVIVTFPPGGTPDIYGRVMSVELSRLWNQSVVVENRTGAGGTIGTDFVAKAAPDGYTLLFAADASITIAPHLYSKLPYDPVRAQQREGADRAGADAAGQGELCVLGRGRPAASCDGVHPHHDGQHGHDPRALQGLRPGHRRRARQPGAAYLRRDHGLDPDDEERQVEGARRHQPQARKGAARCSRDRRNASRFRHPGLVRLYGARR